MILESIVTSRNADGTTNVAPMGPHCHDRELKTFELRPFCTSTTYQNLKRAGQGVLHVTDNVWLFAKAATGAALNGLKLLPASRVQGDVLEDCCRFYEFETTWLDDSGNRASIHCQTVHSERRKDFFGFNRARHAIIEASILATRIDFLPIEEIQLRFREFEPIVSKTGGPSEQQAFEILKKFLAQAGDLTANSSQTVETHQS